jgi:Icc protein
MRVVQLSDCHVSEGAGPTYRGADPRETLRLLVDRIIEWAPDVVLATGDLSEDGSEASYAWLADELARIPARLLTTPGNHDDAVRMKACFADCAVDDAVVLEDDWQLVLVGSAKPGEIGGRFEAPQLEALDAALAGSDRPALVALHHQPFAVGSPWIDRYALAEPERLLRVLARHPRVRLLVWGHVHQDVEIRRQGMVGLGAPSTVSNSLPRQARFTVDPAGPACRWLELDRDGQFRTGLLRPRDER